MGKKLNNFFDWGWLCGINSTAELDFADSLRFLLSQQTEVNIFEALSLKMCVLVHSVSGKPRLQTYPNLRDAFEIESKQRGTVQEKE